MNDCAVDWGNDPAPNFKIDSNPEYTNQKQIYEY